MRQCITLSNQHKELTESFVFTIPHMKQTQKKKIKHWSVISTMQQSVDPVC